MEQDKKDINNKDNIFHYGILKKDSYSLYIITKVQKISKALYLITNFFDVREPIKWSVRDMSLKIVQSAMSISLASLSQREKLVMDFVSIAQEIDIMIETASVAGFISQMNAEVVKRELRGIVAFVEEKHDAHYSTSSKLMLTSGYFKAEDGRPHLISHTAHVPKIEKKETEEPSDRRKKVLDIGRTMKVFSIKDITSHIANCSEKTIQRLLIDMVAEGLLSKEGERRWSKYKIASHK